MTALFTIPPLPSKRKGSERRTRAHKLSKGMAYRHRLAAAEYDLHGMIEAYGLDFVIDFAKRIAAGEVNCSQHVDRWAAHVALNADANFYDYMAKIEAKAEQDAQTAAVELATNVATTLQAVNTFDSIAMKGYIDAQGKQVA